MYFCEYCNKSYRSYDAYLYRHDCKFTQGNRIFSIGRKIQNMLDDLYLNKPLSFTDYAYIDNLRNKVAHDILIQVNKVMNQ